jgi:hypothetical protein
MVFAFGVVLHLWYHPCTEVVRMNTLNAIALAVPTLVVLIGILMNRQENAALRSELRSVEGSLRSEIKSVESSLRSEIKSVESSLRSEIKSVENSLRSEMVQLRNSVHADMVGIHERLATVEAKQA